MKIKHITCQYNTNFFFRLKYLFVLIFVVFVADGPHFQERRK